MKVKKNAATAHGIGGIKYLQVKPKESFIL
jgi:hypothetical protein